MKWMMPDQVFYPLAAIVAVLLIALSTVWPQGLGKRSPAPFGHAEVLPDYYRMVQERDARQKKKAADRAAKAAQEAREAAEDAAASAVSKAR